MASLFAAPSCTDAMDDRSSGDPSDFDVDDQIGLTELDDVTLANEAALVAAEGQPEHGTGAE